MDWLQLKSSVYMDFLFFCEYESEFREKEYSTEYSGVE